MSSNMRNIGLLLALALLVFLVLRHMQSVPANTGLVGGVFSAPTDTIFGNGAYDTSDDMNAGGGVPS